LAGGFGVAGGVGQEYTSLFAVLSYAKSTWRILDVEPNRAIRASKNLTLGEEYLADHFPTFPVMPGVLMLQALVETAAWFLRIRDEFRHSVIVLREARGVKYGNFMEPGRQLLLSAELTEEDGSLASFKGKGEVDGLAAVSAKLTVVRYNLRDRDPAWQPVDERIVKHLRSLYLVLRAAPQAAAAV
jgi:3-hydroxyacyl-[acyl-carrier-protein] dehydratase